MSYVTIIISFSLNIKTFLACFRLVLLDCYIRYLNNQNNPIRNHFILNIWTHGFANLGPHY